MSKKIRDDERTFVKPRLPVPDNEFGPGSFASHEAAYLTAMFRRFVDMELVMHRAIRGNSKLDQQCRKVTAELSKLYRMIGDAQP